ncbi:AAA family ATPase [Mammaliicoccus sciuri]|uniref:AAA family ATPase n=1 Tax=Mammaliicoccus sciuri TaxID=1296 RepID=UPI002DBAA276|nr:AAA family ATPase [Mammaliicoccus sciuri]MEB7735178.1 AAA family ATPase [Mammaliicoccus sciuri]
MANYSWVHENGKIWNENHERKYYQISHEDLKTILTESMNIFYNDTKVIEKESNIFIAEYINTKNTTPKQIAICIKGITPGGRPEKYPDEFRIQQDPKDWDTTLTIMEKENISGVLLGVYRTTDVSEPIFCAWKLQSSGKTTNSQLSKQIRNDAISKAITEGFSQSRTKNEFVCAFRKEFLFFYLNNSQWLHDLNLTELNNYSNEINHEVDLFQDEVQYVNEDIEHLLLKGNPSSTGINRIYFGAPGTGKSYGIKNFIQNNGIKEYNDKISHPNVFRVTLHPEFSYNDFIGQIMPVVKKDDGSSSIEYEFTPQIFTKALIRAFSVRASGEPVFLILEEMSRTNVASVFGDLFQLLDRDVNGISEYKIDNTLIASAVFGENHSDEKIYLPENIFILGTVNTSDQNVFVMDTAFKRRFEFVYISTEELINGANDFTFNLVENGEHIQISWLDLITKLNDFIVKTEEQGGLGLPEDKQLGQFFIKFKEFEIDEMNSEINQNIKKYNMDQITGKLLQYLWNDIEMASYSSLRLFNNQVTSFGKLYKLAKENQNFFSPEFLQLFR